MKKNRKDFIKNYSAKSKKKAESLKTSWIKKEIEKIKYTYGLNKVIRYTLKRQEDLESQSVAEHVYNMLILAHYFRELEDPKHVMDFAKIVRMILMHDMGEIETGDIVMARKTEAHSKKEDAAIPVVARKSPEFISKEIKSLYSEFENPKTPEGKFAKAIDKVEAQFWFGAVCDLKMIKQVTLVEERIKNENKRRVIYPNCGFHIIEKFGKILNDEADKKGLYN